MAPFIALLLKSGLGLVANAALAKGKEFIEEQTGIDVTGPLNDNDLSRLKQYELEHEAELLRLRVEDNRIDAELEKAKLTADVEFQREAQITARVDAQSTDDYVRRTRPRIARMSFYAGIGYTVITGVLFPILNAVGHTQFPGLDAYILGAIYSPCLTLMGVRSVEAFSKSGKR